MEEPPARRQRPTSAESRLRCRTTTRTERARSARSCQRRATLTPQSPTGPRNLARDFALGCNFSRHPEPAPSRPRTPASARRSVRTRSKDRTSGAVAARCLPPALIVHAQVPSGRTAMLASTAPTAENSAATTMKPSSLTRTPAILQPNAVQRNPVPARRATPRPPRPSCIPRPLLRPLRAAPRPPRVLSPSGADGPAAARHRRAAAPPLGCRSQEGRRRLETRPRPRSTVAVCVLNRRVLPRRAARTRCLRLRPRPPHRVDKRQRDIQIQDVFRRPVLRPHQESVLPLGAPRCVLREDEQQRQFQIR